MTPNGTGGGLVVVTGVVVTTNVVVPSGERMVEVAVGYERTNMIKSASVASGLSTGVALPLGLATVRVKSDGWSDKCPIPVG